MALVSSGCYITCPPEVILNDVGLGTRGFPRRSLARPGVRVPAKGSECRQGDEVSAMPSKSLSNSEQLCTESGWAGQMRSQLSREE